MLTSGKDNPSSDFVCVIVWCVSVACVWDSVMNEWMNEWMEFLRTRFYTDYTGPGKTWSNEMNFVMNHAPGAGSITQPVDLQSSALPLCYGLPLILKCVSVMCLCDLFLWFCDDIIGLYDSVICLSNVSLSLWSVSVICLSDVSLWSVSVILWCVSVMCLSDVSLWSVSVILWWYYRSLWFCDLSQ